PREGEPPFAAGGYLRRLAASARPLGLTVFVFAADWIDWTRRTARGYEYNAAKGAWLASEFPLPRLVYDRVFCRSKAELVRHRAALARLRREAGVLLLGRGVGGKWNVYMRLSACPELKELLPATERYAGPAALARWLKARGEAVLKPQGGMQGKEVVCIRRIG